MIWFKREASDCPGQPKSLIHERDSNFLPMPHGKCEFHNCCFDIACSFQIISPCFDSTLHCTHCFKGGFSKLSSDPMPTIREPFAFLCTFTIC